MTTAPTRNPADPRSQPQRPRSGAQQAATTTIDPIRVLRQHATALVGSLLVGLGLGFAANMVLDQSYPL